MEKIKEIVGKLNLDKIKGAFRKLNLNKVKGIGDKLNLNRLNFLSDRGKQILMVGLGVILATFVITILALRDNGAGQETSTMGNSIATIMTGGHLSTQGDFLFYSTEEGLFKSSSDLNERTLISTYSVENINVVGEWIYFTIPDKYGIFRIRMDGTDMEELSGSIRTRTMLVAHEKIYFTLNGIIYEMDLEGDSKQALTPAYLSTTAFDLDDEWIYFTVRSIAGDFLPEHGFYKVRHDGTDIQQLLEIPIIHFPFIVHDEWIYFVHVYEHLLELDGNGMYRFSIDGSETLELIYAFDSIMRPLTYLNILHDTIYFSVGYEGFRGHGEEPARIGLRSIALEDGAMETVSTASSNVIHIQGDRIFHRQAIDFERTSFAIFKTLLGEDERHVLN